MPLVCAGIPGGGGRLVFVVGMPGMGAIPVFVAACCMCVGCCVLAGGTYSPVSFANFCERFLLYEIFLSSLSALLAFRYVELRRQSGDGRAVRATLANVTGDTYNLAAIEFCAVLSAHGLLGYGSVAEGNMCLTAHLAVLDCDDVEDMAVGCEEVVELADQIVFLHLLGQLLDIEGLAWVGGRCDGGRFGGTGHSRTGLDCCHGCCVYGRLCDAVCRVCMLSRDQCERSPKVTQMFRAFCGIPS